MKTILSTKKLSPSQKEHLLNAGLAVVDYDFIACQGIPFSIDKKYIENAIFTSQNGIKYTLQQNLKIKNSFCVGQRTKKMLEQHQIPVVECGKNAQELSVQICNNHADKHFDYFCAKARLDTLPDALSKNQISMTEIPVYETLFTSKEYPQQFNGVLFYSPSGVESYFSKNQAPAHSFCIGNTTANSLKKYSNNYTIASTPSVENVLVKVIKHFKNHD